MGVRLSDELVEQGAATAKGAARSIDDAPLNRFHVKMTVLTFGAHFTAGYVMGSIALALAGLCSCMEVSATWQGLLGSSALVGVFVGSILTGLVADKFGRQKIFLTSFVVITIAAALQYFATGPMSLFVLRIIVGMAIGADYSVGVTLLTEVLPRKERGPLLGCLVAVWTVGYVAASFAGVFVFEPNDWNVLLASSAIPALIVLLLRAGTPESPRWLASKGRHEEAQAIIDKYIGEGYVLEEEPLTEKPGVRALFNRKTIRSLAFVCIFWSLNVIPYFGVYTFLPIILQEFGFPETQLVDIALNVVLLAGAVVGIFLIAKCTRRMLSISTFAVSGACLAALAFLPEGSTIAQAIAFALFTITIAAQGDMTSVYPAEVFPTETRSTCIGIATGFSRFASALGTFALPVIVGSLGMSFALGLLGALSFAGLALCVLFAPETKDLSLVDASSV